MNQFSRLKKLPPYVFTTMGELKQQMISKGCEIFDFGLGNPDQPTPAHIVEALQKAALNPSLHRYSHARGIKELRKALTDWYGRRFNVDLDPETETISTIGSKEGLAHLFLATLTEEDSVVIPDPCYPVHFFGCVIAGANIHHVPLLPDVDFLATLEEQLKTISPKPKMLVLNFPGNPTTHCVDLPFFERIIALAKEYSMWVVHDFAYADLGFDGYQAPSILQVPGAKDIAVESFTLSKSYNMAGWRIGFMSGNPTLVQALAKIKSYIDYGSFAPAQVAAIAALEGPDNCVAEIRNVYQRRRDFMCNGLRSLGWQVNIPKATMFLWLKVPEPFQHLDSFSFAKLLLQEANVVVSPGIGFGEHGKSYFRISLIEDEARMIKALENIKQFMQKEVQSMPSMEFVPT